MMVKISYIGAGSKVFTLKLVSDILSFPEMRKNCEISLMDVNKTRLNHTFDSLISFKEKYAEELSNVEFTKTLDQRESISGARHVISSFMVGGKEAYSKDFKIPRKYGVRQVVGDTLGPGGIFRFLRSVPVLQSIIQDMKEVGYNSNEEVRAKPLLLNYVNPMAMNTWYCNAIAEEEVDVIGLCHGVQHTAQLGLQWWVGASEDELYYKAAGINHMAWFIDLKYKDPFNKNATWKDAYPIIQEHVKEEPQLVGTEKVRFDMMDATGYFMTESSGHLSEYLPYYLKRDDLIEKYGAGDGVNSLRHAWDLDAYESSTTKINEKAEVGETENLVLKNTPSEEYAARIINAMEYNQLFIFNGNVMNKNGGLITNLPAGCCVEVPCTANSSGIHPHGGIELPTICAGLCSSNIWLQKAAVQGALEKNKELIFHALMLDPNTASVCSPGEIRSMTNEMFEANQEWLEWFYS